MPSEDYDVLAAEGDALAERVKTYGIDTGRVLVIGKVPGRNAPKYSVMERGHGRVLLGSWAPWGDGWLEKAEQECRKAGLLPSEEDVVPAPSEQEVQRSSELRPRLRELREAAGSIGALAKAAVEECGKAGVEQFGSGATSNPVDIVQVQLSKFLAEPNPTNLLDRNLGKWEAIVEALEDRYGVEHEDTGGAETRVAPPTGAEEHGTLSLETPEGGEFDLRDRIAELDDELAEATTLLVGIREALAEAETQRDGLKVDLHHANEKLVAVEKDRDIFKGRWNEAQEKLDAIGDRGDHAGEAVMLEREKRERAETRAADLERQVESWAQERTDFQDEIKSLRERVAEEQASAATAKGALARVEPEPEYPFGGGHVGPARVILSGLPDPVGAAFMQDAETRRRYADTLLRKLDSDSGDPELVMKRLDRLVGLEAESVAA